MYRKRLSEILDMEALMSSAMRRATFFTRPCGKGVMTCALVAHADEIGIQITSVEEPA